MARAHHAAKAARHEEARKTKHREEATKAAELVAKAAKLAAAHALTEAREHEQRMVIQAALTLKVEETRTLPRWRQQRWP